MTELGGPKTKKRAKEKQKGVEGVKVVPVFLRNEKPAAREQRGEGKNPKQNTPTVLFSRNSSGNIGKISYEPKGGRCGEG